MANTIEISCPECHKQIKAAPELQGKKVRCKGCGHVFPIPAPDKPGKEAKPAVVMVAKKGDDDDDVTAYAVAKEESTALPRCPHCALEMESEDAVVCIHCGYNTLNRQRMMTRKTYETTAGDRLGWLMPGFLSLFAIFVLIGFDLFFCLKLPKMVEKDEDWSWLGSGPVRLWMVIFSVFAMLALAKFAFSRLIVNRTPPEKIKH
jgi:DNA-directed RNA polymerase subunit M/transcription elongation factor TFIIS